MIVMSRNAGAGEGNVEWWNDTRVVYVGGLMIYRPATEDAVSSMLVHVRR